MVYMCRQHNRQRSIGDLPTDREIRDARNADALLGQGNQGLHRGRDRRHG